MAVGPVGGMRKVSGLYFDPALEGTTYTTGATGTAGYGGAVSGAAPAAGMILGPWANDDYPDGSGDTAATEEDDDCCCCCRPCDPCEKTTPTAGNTITSSPVDASRATGGMVITGSKTPANVFSGPKSQSTTSGGPHVSAPGFDTDSIGLSQTMATGPQPSYRTQAQVMSVPGYAGPLQSYAQANTSSQATSGKDDCCCGCKGKTEPESGTKGLPPIPSVTAATVEDSPYTDVIEVEPMASRTVLDRTILAGPTDGAKFASYSRDLLADVLTVSGGGMPPAEPVPGATLVAAVARVTPSPSSGATFLAAAARPESAVLLRRTISG